MRIPAGQFTSFLGLAGAHAAPSAIVDIPDHLHTTIRRNQVFSVEESSICTASKIIEIQYIIEKRNIDFSPQDFRNKERGEISKNN